MLARFRRDAYPRRVKKLIRRPRRLRRSVSMRNLVRETRLGPEDFVLPLFVSQKIKQARAIESMPGVSQFAIGEIAREAGRAHAAGLQAVLLFGIPENKDERATGAYADDGIVQDACRRIKKEFPDLLVMTDVC